MILDVSRKIFHRNGFRINGIEYARGHRRCVVTAAPHTSNLDVFYTLAAFDLLGLPVKFTIKQEWLRFPVRKLLLDAGALPIDRTPRENQPDKPSMTQLMIELFEKHEGDLALAITPEGTRSLRTEWKTGFWHVARQAGVPIILGYLDYARKEAGFGGIIHPTDLETDMRTLARFYRTITPRYPHLYSVDLRYADGAGPDTPASGESQ